MPWNFGTTKGQKGIMSAALWLPDEIRTADNQSIISLSKYPDPVQGIEIIGK